MSTRRELLKSVSLVAALPAARLAARQLQAIGVQLYTVRSMLPQKPAETLHSIESIGYREIEPTYDGLERLWPAIQATHLKAVSVHLDNTLMNARQGGRAGAGHRTGEEMGLRLRRLSLPAAGRARRPGQDPRPRRQAEPGRREVPRRGPRVLLSQPRFRIRADGGHDGFRSDDGTPRQEPLRVRTGRTSG